MILPSSTVAVMLTARFLPGCGLKRKILLAIRLLFEYAVIHGVLSPTVIVQTSEMRTHDYQQSIFAYHGCDASVRDRVIQHSDKLEFSQNDYDWCGHGIYFWEHGPKRALEWAQRQQKRGKIKNPAVLGAILNLGNCFDLLDATYTDILVKSYPDFCEFLRVAGKNPPKNEPSNPRDPDNVLRKLDCAAVNWTIERLQVELRTKFDSVRGVFQEGEEVFPNSGIRRRSHIQIAVRTHACIIGYFLPSSDDG